MSTKTFSIDFPDTVDGEIDALYVKESVAVTLYHAGKISEKQACLILGKTKLEFGDLLSKYGFSILSDVKDSMAVKSGETEKVTPPLSKWARLAEEVHNDNTFAGLSKDIIKNVKEFRENFAFKHDE